MIIEIAVGTTVAWLWGKLADSAQDKDNQNAIKNALEESIDQSFRLFQKKHGDKSEMFFNEDFIEKSACPEILKLLTRNLQPDIDAVCNELPVKGVFASDSAFRDELKDFFDMVFESMKSYPALQELLDHRQIDETNQLAKESKEWQKTTSEFLGSGFDKIEYEQKETNNQINELLAQNTVLINAVAVMQNQLGVALPDKSVTVLNKFLSKQLDNVRDLINLGKVVDAQTLLESFEEETSESDDFTRYRWHTNLGACFLFNDKNHESAEQYLTAYNFAKADEKAVANRVRAFILIGEFNTALEYAKEAIKLFPESGINWSLYINANIFLHLKVDPSKIPSSLLKDTSVLLTLSDLKLREKNYEESFHFAEEALKIGLDSQYAKRAMLAAALSWATSDNVKSEYRQLTVNQYNALKQVTDSYRDILAVLRDIQSKSIFVEVAHNLAVATELLGDEQLRNKITQYAFSIYPDEDAFLWYKINELKQTKDIEGIHKLTDSKLIELQKPLLFSIAEVAANTGDVDWVNLVVSALNSHGLNGHDYDELFGMELCAVWKSGDESAAISLARENISRIKSSPSLLSFYVRILGEHKEINERDKLLELCKNLPEDASSVSLIQTADLLYDFSLFYDSSVFFERLIEAPGNDYLTKRYIDSLIKSDQRVKAKTIIESLPSEIRNISSFKRLEANLARASGDLDKLEVLLSEELKDTPTDSSVAFGYIATLYRKGELKALKEYLKTNPSFNPVIEQNEIEIAKFQMEFGYEHDALLRIYSLFRNNPGNSELAGHFMLLRILAKNNDQYQDENEVTTGVVVYLKSEDENKKIVIEPSNLKEGFGWPECISEENELAKNLLGKKRNDVVHLNSGFVTKEWEIINIESMFLFASNIAHGVVANSASSSGPLWSVNVKKDNDEFDFSPILESLKQRSNHVEYVFNLYKEKHVPLEMLSKALGTDMVTLLLEWPINKYDLFICTGVHDELEAIKEQILNGNKPYVLDFSFLIEFHSLGFLKESLKILGKPLIASSLKESLLRIIQIHNKLVPSGTAYEIDGQLQYQDIPQASLDNRESFLNELLEFIDNHCDVVPVVGPDSVTEQQADIEQHIGLVSNDSILLTLERDAILVSEDGGLRALAANMEGVSSSWVQPILMILRDKRIITQTQYASSIFNKLKRRHNFTSFTANDLLWAAKKSPKAISSDVELSILTFKSKLLDLASGVVVGTQFLFEAAHYFSPKLLYNYHKLMFESLSYGRDSQIDQIHEALRLSIVSSLTEMDSKKTKLIFRKFGSQLEAPQPKRIVPKLKPLVVAIRLALKSYR